MGLICLQDIKYMLLKLLSYVWLAAFALVWVEVIMHQETRVGNVIKKWLECVYSHSHCGVYRSIELQQLQAQNVGDWSLSAAKGCSVWATYSFQWARFLLFLCCVADWMRRESGVKGLKLTRGVCNLLPLSVIDFPEVSAFLNRATLLLEYPKPESLALDNKLCKRQIWSFVNA